MQAGPHRAFAGSTTIATAAIGCLQPGIDPVFLTILSAAHGLDPLRHGWIVGATQGGMALGALAVWRYRHALPARRMVPMAAGFAFLCGIATALFGDFAALLLIRGLFGLAMGVIYTDAMSEAAARRPTTAYAAVFLAQLLLSTAVALLLPFVSDAVSPRAALVALTAGPLVIAGLALTARPWARILSGAPPFPAPGGTSVPPAAWALAAAAFAFICATMLVWSFTGALAAGEGLDEEVIGFGVALGSVVGALTAIAVMRERPLVPLPLTGLLAGLCLLSPLVLIPLGGSTPFIGAVLLLNIGSTAIIIRCSGAATAASGDPLFRRFVACTHPLGMIAGPVLGAVMAGAAGRPGLEAGALSVLVAAMAALLFARRQVPVATGAGAGQGVAA
ncbi:MAG: MFS transporter [Sphingobium sp.]|nr:MAG: MFS transporter [Sphingobium sp.]